MPSKATIRGIQWSVGVDSITDNTIVQLEISKASAREVGINGAQQCISEHYIYGNFVTSGLSILTANDFAPVNVPVIQGQIIYGHAAVAGTVVYYASALIQWE
jgi:hypothetical protein